MFRNVLWSYSKLSANWLDSVTCCNLLGSTQVIRIEFFVSKLFIYFRYFCSPKNSLNFPLATLLRGYELSIEETCSALQLPLQAAQQYLTLIFAVSRSPNGLSFLFLRNSCSLIHFPSVSLQESHATRTLGRKKLFHQSTVKTKMAPWYGQTSHRHPTWLEPYILRESYRGR